MSREVENKMLGIMEEGRKIYEESGLESPAAFTVFNGSDDDPECGYWVTNYFESDEKSSGFVAAYRYENGSFVRFA